MNHLKEPITFYVHLINTKNVEKINVLTMTRCEEMLCSNWKFTCFDSLTPLHSNCHNVFTQPSNLACVKLLES